jgi:hypothetical protein
MTLDSEQQRQILLQLIQNATFPGAALDLVYDLKQRIAAAKIVASEDGGSPQEG